MIKILPAAIILVLMVGFVLYLRFSQTPEKPISPTLNTTKTITSDSSSSERLVTLEEAVALLNQKVNNQNTDANLDNNTPSTSSDLDSRLKKLENSIASLQKQLTSQPTSTPQTTTPKSPIYIPLGWVGSSTATDWSTVTSQEFTFNSDDYPGYTSMQFEVNLRAFQGNGKAYARILNNTDGVGIIGSEVTTSTQDYTWISSGSFSPPSGKKALRLQLKSLTGYETGVQNARLKINY